MTARTLLHLNGTTNKCLFATVYYFKPQLQISQYRQIRSVRRLTDNIRGYFPKSESPFANVEIGNIKPVKLWKHFAFAATFTGATIACATIWEHEYIKRQTNKILNNYAQFRIRRTGWRGEIETWWRKLSEGEKMFAPILFLNMVVYLAWRVPAWKRTMLRYFSTSPASSVSYWPMVLSVFSHYNLLHLSVNMYVLHNISTVMGPVLGKEQFLALYLSSGVMASFASHVYKTIIGKSVVSLGASGAVMGILGYLCTAYPEIKLHIIFLPMIQLAAGAAIKAIMIFDITGCFLRWQFIDHAAHLGGTLFGIFWQAWGCKHIWGNRQHIVDLWNEFRDIRKP